MIKARRINKNSLKVGLLRTISLGFILAIVVYFLIMFISEQYRTNVYITEDNRDIREDRLVSEFQAYVDAKGLTSEDEESIRHWVQQKTYINLMFYKGTEVFFSSGMYDNANVFPLFSNLLLGGTIDYPSEEEMREYAQENRLAKVQMADGVYFVSITEFSEYFYRNIANIFAIGLSLLALALVITIYFFKVVKRITKLAADVTVVTDGDMNCKIHAHGNDEISKLSHDIEDMRSAILATLDNERAAREANTALITSMSHDIRTPLTVLIGYLDIMKTYSNDETYGDETEEALGRYV